MIHLEDNAYFDEVKRGSYSAFNQLFNNYYRPLCNFVIRYVQDPDDAEDIVQELFTKLWIQREEIEIRHSVRSYLFSATKNATLNYLRQEKSRRKAVDGIPIPDLDSFDTSLEDEEFDRALEKCINELPERSKQAFLLSRSEGLKQAEIAERMNTSIKTVKNQIWKSLQYLKECLVIKKK